MKQLLMIVSLTASIAIAAVPNIGERPPDFKLSTPEGSRRSWLKAPWFSSC